MSREAGQTRPEEPASPSDRGIEPVLPVRSPDDTDIGWGERAEQDNDDRLRRDRPPHWDSA